MIDPKELRIGNLIDVINRKNSVHLPTGIELRIITVGMFDVMCVPNEINDTEITGDIIMTIPIRDLSPIPLTPEILNEFGFTICVDVMHIVSDGNIYLPLVIYEDHFKYITKNLQYIIIKHVHQLQNLYFALTGTELERRKK